MAQQGTASVRSGRVKAALSICFLYTGDALDPEYLIGAAVGARCSSAACGVAGSSVYVLDAKIKRAHREKMLEQRQA